MFLVGPRDTFTDLADAIDSAFGRWDLAHLHAFELSDGRRLGRAADEELDFEDGGRIRVVGTVRAGEAFTYVFDLGDDWTHRCLVEAVDIDLGGENPPTPCRCSGGGPSPISTAVRTTIASRADHRSSEHPGGP